MVTFGDILTLAGHHLDEADRKLQATHPHPPTRDPSLRAELVRLTTVLARYSDRIATNFNAPAATTTETQQPARRTAALLHQATRLLGEPSGAEPPTSPLAENLRAGSIALGSGLDLLATHFSQTNSPDTAVIRASDTAHDLLRTIGQHAQTAARIAQHLTTLDLQASQVLHQAAASTVLTTPVRPSPVTAVRFHHRPARIPPAIGEDHDQAMTGLNATTQRLSNPNPAASITTWRYLATASAITFDITHMIAIQLQTRMNELDQPDHAHALRRAARHARRTSLSWKTLARNWTALVQGHADSDLAT
ncbi:hypothetical protein ACFQ07_22480, partial [Actinomadura adrarensis]